MTANPTDFGHLNDVSGLDIEAELAAFEAAERARLGLDTEKKEHWTDANPQRFVASQRAHTTILVGGLTMAHDFLLDAGLRGAGYNMQALEVPTNNALRIGKEFGNRGQCNPTYFTVGNLVKSLQDIEAAEGLSKQEIVDNYVFLTAGACGPCRFGTYATEYRKALRDAGFDGFRVLLFQQMGGMKQATGEELGLKFDFDFFRVMVLALLLGDVLNAIGYKIRPYELEEGATDRAIDACKSALGEAMKTGKWHKLGIAMLKCRSRLASISVDRTRIKPKVGIIGEFWAMTTEGDGNYKMQSFLQQEGAEVDIQLVTAWLLYMLWENIFDTKERAKLRDFDDAPRGIRGTNVRKKLAYLQLGDVVVRLAFQGFAHTLGLHNYHLANMDEVADVSHAFYNNDLRGGEGHMEVGKLLLNVINTKVNMTLSIKPFGCMPSSGVSDGVQSMITELYPEAIFLPIETSGDGEVNVQSRVQMMLFKAKQQAEKETARVLEKHGLTMGEVREFVLKYPILRHPLLPLPHHHGNSAADLVELVAAMKNPVKTAKSLAKRLFGLAPKKDSVAVVAARLAERRKEAGKASKAAA